MRNFIAGIIAAIGFGTTAQACSIDTACSVGARDYYIAMPEQTGEPVPAVVYLHGAGGSGAGALRNRTMVSAFNARGFAVIAPDGVARAGRNGRGWGFHPSSGRQMDEVAFLIAVRDDAIARFGLDTDQIVLGGFSIGGSMAAYTACLAPDAFSAYAPMGGNFWRPHPVECEGPVRLLHTHGWTDGTVPLEGRVLNNVPANDPGARAQGDVFHAMSIWRETNECMYLKADRFVTEGAFWRRIWDRCADGTALELAIFPGGHRVPQGWADLVVDWFEDL
ncbi:alpha/beta fold hydrolase [Yoonia sp. BS5-3]|uniref:PHB depolymerase family esterase n=1 Tax=Yoonia phaeophyticola TaxID=3137369 RepID=A0ABZ2VAS3_9RHOB